MTRKFFVVFDEHDIVFSVDEEFCKLSSSKSSTDDNDFHFPKYIRKTGETQRRQKIGRISCPPVWFAPARAGFQLQARDEPAQKRQPPCWKPPCHCWLRVFAHALVESPHCANIPGCVVLEVAVQVPIAETEVVCVISAGSGLGRRPVVF